MEEAAIEAEEAALAAEEAELEAQLAALRDIKSASAGEILPGSDEGSERDDGDEAGMSDDDDRVDEEDIEAELQALQLEEEVFEAQLQAEEKEMQETLRRLRQQLATPNVQDGYWTRAMRYVRAHAWATTGAALVLLLALVVPFLVRMLPLNLEQIPTGGGAPTVQTAMG